MVLYNEGQGDYFQPHLLKFLRGKKDIRVMNILQSYYTTESPMKLSQLRDNYQATLLHHAAKYGNSVIVEYLLNCFCEINAQDNRGRTPLMLAACGGHEDAFEVLLKANADIHITNDKGENVLQLIFKNEKNRYAVIGKLLESKTWRKLIEEIISTDTKIDEFGNTSKVAVRLENDELIKILKSRQNADETCEIHGELSLLHIAVKNKMTKMIKVLINFGANVDALDPSKATPLLYLCNGEYMNNNTDEFLEMLKLFVSCAKSVTLSNDRGAMQIFNALLFANSEAIKIILRSNIDLLVADKKGNTALHYLARNCNINLFELIRCRKFYVNGPNKYGYAPLHLAVECNSLDAMKFLLKYGAEIDKPNDIGETPLFSEFTRPLKLNKQLVEILLEFGADPQIFVKGVHDRDICTIFDMIIIVSGIRNPFLREPLTLEQHLDKAKPILARLAIIQESGSEITQLTRQKIYLKEVWVKYFEKCQQQLEKMKSIVVYGDVKMIEFLTECETKILAYVRNRELVLNLERHIAEFEVNSPYPDLLRSRLRKIIRLANSIEKAINMVCRLVNPAKMLLHSIGEKIVNYLNYWDKDNLVLLWDE